MSQLLPPNLSYFCAIGGSWSNPKLGTAPSIAQQQAPTHENADQAIEQVRWG
ncbi:MAG: hypothetical protein ACKO6M_05290 [Bacteroidota bacterium]